jgi:ribose transport system permease protein
MSAIGEIEPPPAEEAVGKTTVARRVLRFGMLSLGKYGALIVLVLLVIIFSTSSPYFLTPTNVLEILNAASLAAIIAMGLTMILVGNQFDLSLGFLASCTGILITHLMMMGIALPLAILCGLALGVVTGIVNGSLVTRWHINALVATLGTGSCLVGVNYAISSGTPQDVSGIAGFTLLTVGHWFGIPKLVFYMVGIAAILWVILNKTDFGRNLQACGGNDEAARLAGVRVPSTITLGYICVGVCASATGILLSSSIGSGQVTAGDTYTLSSFAAAFLGSTVMREGQFHIIGTLVGVILVSAGFDGLALLGVPAYMEELFSGVLLICAVAFSSLGRSLTRD